MTTRGQFLAEKGNNMSRWLTEEFPGDMRITSLTAGELTPTSAMYLADALLERKELVAKRDIAEIKGAIGSEHGAALDMIQASERVRDKFWRYMDLFVEVAGQ